MPKFDDAKVRAVCNAMLIEAEKAQSDARWVQLVRTADRLAHIGAPYEPDLTREEDRKSTRLNSSHSQQSRMPSSA